MNAKKKYIQNIVYGLKALRSTCGGDYNDESNVSAFVSFHCFWFVINVWFI